MEELPAKACFLSSLAHAVPLRVFLQKHKTGLFFLMDAWWFLSKRFDAGKKTSGTVLLADCYQAVGICMLGKTWQEIFLELSISVTFSVSVQPLLIGFFGVGGWGRDRRVRVLQCGKWAGRSMAIPTFVDLHILATE